MKHKCGRASSVAGLIPDGRSDKRADLKAYFIKAISKGLPEKPAALFLVQLRQRDRATAWQFNIVITDYGKLQKTYSLEKS